MSTDQVVTAVVETAVLRPGDILVVSLQTAMSPMDIDGFADLLKSRVGDAVRVLVIGGAVQLHVIRPSEVAR